MLGRFAFAFLKMVFAFALVSQMVLEFAAAAAPTDKVAQGNFAYGGAGPNARLFAITDDGTSYKLTKRDVSGDLDGHHPSERFALGGKSNPFQKTNSDFTFALAKRSVGSGSGDDGGDEMARFARLARWSSQFA